MKKVHFSSKPQQISKSVNKICEKIFGDLFNQRLLLIGGDSMSNLIVKRLSVKGIKKFKKLKYDKRKPKNVDVNFFNNEKIPGYLLNFDIIITASKFDKLLLEKDEIIIALKKRKQKPLLLIDTNVPGNIDSNISDVDNCFLFDLNDLEQFYNDNITNEFQSDLEFEDYNFDFYDILEELLPKVSNKLLFNSEQEYIFEQKIKIFFESKSTYNEKISMLNFLKFFIKN